MSTCYKLCQRAASIPLVMNNQAVRGQILESALLAALTNLNSLDAIQLQSITPMAASPKVYNVIT